MKIDFLSNLLDKSINSNKECSFINNFINEIKEVLIKKQ